MPRERLINCDFINSGSFSKISNKSKLLYLKMFVSADDRGFVDNVGDIVESLETADLRQGNTDNLTLLSNDYISALNELIDRGYLIAFPNKYGDVIYLIKHWYYHNRFTNKVRTNYYNFYLMVEVVNGKYRLKEKPLKEKNINENKINENKINEIKGETPNPTEPNQDEEWDKMMNELEEKGEDDYGESN